MRGLFWHQEEESPLARGLACVVVFVANPLSLIGDRVGGGEIFWEHFLFIKLLLRVESSCYV